MENDEFKENDEFILINGVDRIDIFQTENVELYIFGEDHLLFGKCSFFTGDISDILDDYLLFNSKSLAFLFEYDIHNRDLQIINSVPSIYNIVTTFKQNIETPLFNPKETIPNFLLLGTDIRGILSYVLIKIILQYMFLNNVQMIKKIMYNTKFLLEFIINIDYYLKVLEIKLDDQIYNDLQVIVNFFKQNKKLAKKIFKILNKDKEFEFEIFENDFEFLNYIYDICKNHIIEMDIFLNELMETYVILYILSCINSNQFDNIICYYGFNHAKHISNFFENYAPTMNLIYKYQDTQKNCVMIPEYFSLVENINYNIPSL